MDVNWCADHASGIVFVRFLTGSHLPNVIERVEAVEDSFVFLIILVVSALTPATTATTTI